MSGEEECYKRGSAHVTTGVVYNLRTINEVIPGGVGERRLGNRSEAGYSPSGTCHSSCSFDSASEDDELDTVNH